MRSYFKVLKRAIVFINLILCLWMFSNNVVFAANENVQIPITIKQFIEVENKLPHSKEIEGVYEISKITSESSNQDENENQKKIIKLNQDKDSETIILKYSQTGVYKYQIRQITQSNKNYMIDDTIYELIVYVTNGTDELIPQVIVKNQEGIKCGDITYHNKFVGKEEVSYKKTPVRTGDKNNLTLWTLGTLGSIVLFILLINYKRKKTKESI